MNKLLLTLALLAGATTVFAQNSNSDYFDEGKSEKTINHALKMSLSDIIFGRLGLMYEVDFDKRINLEVGGGTIFGWFYAPSSILLSRDEYDVDADGGYYLSISPIIDLCDCDLDEYWGIGLNYTYYGLNATTSSSYKGLSTLSATINYQQYSGIDNLYWFAKLGLGLTFYSQANGYAQPKTYINLPLSAGIGYAF